MRVPQNKYILEKKYYYKLYVSEKNKVTRVKERCKLLIFSTLIQIR